MSISYSLIPNYLTDNPGDHMAIVEDQERRTVDDAVREIMKHGTTLDELEVRGVIDKYHEVLLEFLAQGDRVATPIFETNVSISGTFENDEDRFDRSRHYLRHNFNPGPAVGPTAADLTVQKVRATSARPILDHFRDIASGTEDDTLTPGKPAEIRGSRLKVDTTDPEQGIFFIAADETEHRVETIMHNMPSKLIFMVPDGLASGPYEVEVRALLHGHTEIRRGDLNKSLIVP